MSIKLFIANTLVKWFKQFPFFGRQRFWILYWAYRITGWHIRHKEWDFVLEYLPKLGSWQKVRVLDVGCNKNLLAHEIVYRGYDLVGIDLEEIDIFDYPAISYIKDIREELHLREFDFITCISVLEHIGDGNEEDQRKAIENMLNVLKVGGRLLLTIPTKEFAQGHPWHGFNSMLIEGMLPYRDLALEPYAKIIEYTERAGQVCMAIERLI